MNALRFLLIFLQFQINNGLFTSRHPVPVVKPVRVQAPAGVIVGRFETISFDGQTYNISKFLGIPYAEPPVGGNRFRKPVPKAPFSSPYSAFDYGTSCLQGPHDDSKFKTAEDCLFLNVFVPGMTSGPGSKIPVMVWIHGGGFTTGSSVIYPGDNLSVYGQLIVVTLNYRLSHMGFLRTKESAANFGLWDQHLAIKWVNDNIGSFGGDVNNITIFGESAGSSSVSYQVLFPGNKGLFHRAIAMSGGITSEWAYSTAQYADSVFQNFTAEIGCNMGTHDMVMSCLRSKSTLEISNVIKSGKLMSGNVVPNRDSDFIPKHPQEMMAPSTASKGSLDVFRNIDFMMGGCSIDGALFLRSYAATLNITDLEKFKVSRDMFEKYFVPKIISTAFSNIQPIPQVANNATVFEYTNWADPDDDNVRNFKLVDLSTDASMFYPMAAMIKLHTGSHNHSTYLYEFSTPPTTHLIPVPNWLKGPTQSIHADDLFFVFGFPDQMIKQLSTEERPLIYRETDIKKSKVIMSIWTNFAKSGYVYLYEGSNVRSITLFPALS